MGALERLTNPDQMGRLFKVLYRTRARAAAAGISSMIRLSAPVLTQPGIAHGFFRPHGWRSQGLRIAQLRGARLEGREGQYRGETDDARWSPCRPEALSVTLYQSRQKNGQGRKTLGPQRCAGSRPMVTNIPGIALGILAAGLRARSAC